MASESSSISSMIAHVKMVGYYAGVAFGVGYILVFAGVIAMAAEYLASIPVSAWSYILANVPGWLIAGLICYLIAVILGIAFGASVIRSSMSVKDKGLHLSTMASSISIFSFMIIFAAIGSIVIISGLASSSYFNFLGSSLVYPICNIVGAILLLIGFRTYHGKQVESKIVGAVMMLISVALIYIIALGPVGAGFTGIISYAPSSVSWLPATPGPLLAQSTLETITLLLATVAAIVLAVLTAEERIRNAIGAVILSASAILFSIGLMYFNFSEVAALGNTLSSTAVKSIWVLFFGFLLLGIAGIVIIITACLVLAVSAKQVSTRPAQPPPSQPPSP